MNLRTACVFAVVGALATPGAAGAAEPPATQPTPQQLRETKQRLNEQFEAAREAAHLPAVTAQRVEEFLQFWIEDDFLAARTKVSPVDGEVRVITPALPGIVRVRVHELQAVDDHSVGRNFSLVQNDLTKPRNAVIITHVASIGGRIILARDAESDTYRYSVQLIQDPPGTPLEIEEHPVRLLIRHHNDPEGPPNVNVTLAADSFSDLRRRYPREVETYLRPILREYQQDAVLFAVDPRVAWQVLGNEYTPDDDALAKVRAIVAQFDSEDFRQRRSAAEQLNRMGQQAVLVLERIDRSTLSPEQATGVDTFLAEYQPLEDVDVQRLRNSADFLLDTLRSDDAALRRLAWRQLKRVHPLKLEFDPDAPPAQRDEQLERLRDALMPPAVIPEPANDG